MIDNFKERKRKQISDEIAKKQKELEELENAATAPVVELSDISTEEKVKFFDGMYKMAADHLKACENETDRDDDDHWFYEYGFTALNMKNPKALWSYKNKVSR